MMCKKIVLLVVVVLWSLLGTVNAGVISGSNITATASSTAAGLPGRAVNGAGRYIGPNAGGNYDPTGIYHEPGAVNVWLSSNRNGTDSAFSGTAVGPEWLVLQFDQVYAMADMKVWNYNSGPNLGARGIKEVSIDYSTNGTSWTRLMNGSNNFWTFAQAPDAWQYTANTNVNFGGASAKFVVITPKDGATGQWGGDGYYGLSELEFSGNPIPEPATMILLGIGSLLLRKRAA